MTDNQKNQSLKNISTMNLILLILLFIWLITFVYRSYTTIVIASGIMETMDTYIQENELDPDKIHYELVTGKNDNNYIIYLKDDSINEIVLLYDDGTLTEITDYFTTLKEKIAFTNESIKKVYYNNKSIISSDYMSQDLFYIKGVLSLVENDKYKIEVALVDGLYESDTEKVLLKDKSVIFVNDVIIINELNDIDNIKEMHSLGGNQDLETITNFAYFTYENKEYLIYLESNNFYYITRNGESVSQAERVNEDIAKTLVSYIESNSKEKDNIE